MKRLIILDKLPKNLSCLVTTFEEEYNKYLRNTSKRNWQTEEGFSLDFDSCLEDLKKAYFVYVDDPKLEAVLRKRLNVIE